LDLYKLASLKAHLPGQFERVMEVLNHVVDTKGAPLDLAIVEQTCDRCKQLADGLKYLQAVLPTIQVVCGEDAVASLLVRVESVCTGRLSVGCFLIGFIFFKVLFGVECL
jgi:hypothetical protein